MKPSELLRITAMTKTFEITDRKHYFVVKHLGANLVALVYKKESTIFYDMTGCRNLPFDWIGIDVQALDELREFASYMQEVLENERKNDEAQI